MAFNPLELVKAVVTGEVAVKGVTKAISLLYGQEIESLLASVKAAGAQATPTNHELERAPLKWAMTLNNLGNALRALGQRGDDAALANAVAAFENALLEYTRERAPRHWAMTQNNLGYSLLTLGQRGDDDALAKAVAAYEMALLERTRERVPLEWAMTQENMALAEMALGDRGRGPDMWRAALARVEAALEEFRTRSPYNTAKAEWLATDLRARLNLPE